MRRIGPIALALLAIRSPAAAAQATCDTCSTPAVSALEKPKAEDPRAETLKRRDAEIDAASLQGDRQKLEAALAAGMVAVDAAGEITPRDRVLASVAPSKPAMKVSISADDVRVMFFGDTAIVAARKTRQWESGGRQRSMKYREANTYVRRGARWLLIVSQSYEEPPPYFARDVAFDLPFDESRAVGDRQAPVVLFEFSDYECPHCRRFAAQTLAKVEKEYVETGRAALVLRDNPLEDSHPRALAAAAAAHCAASQGKFREMNERLLRDPVELSDEELARDAREIGLDSATFERCVVDPATARAVRSGKKEANDLGIVGTPIFVVGIRKPGEPTVRALRMIEGAFPYEVFKTTLDGVIRSRIP